MLGFTGTWESTDALHCRVKGIPDLDMLQIFHNPLNDNTEPEENGYRIEMFLDGLSEAGLIEDSIKVFWKMPESNTWLTEPLYASVIPEEPDTWSGWIPALADSGLIQYFIQGADSSGRVERSPLAGWHTFFAYPTDACLEWVLGDLDNSGETNVMDILLLSDLIASSEGFGICPGTVSDLNNDGDISVIDVVFLVNLILNP